MKKRRRTKIYHKKQRSDNLLHGRSILEREKENEV